MAKEVTDRQKVAAINFAIEAVRFAHGGMLGEPHHEHSVDAARCGCAYGESIRGLKAARRDAYVAIQKGKVTR